MGKSLGDKKVILSLIGLQWIYSFLWGFSSGYPRYFIFGIMLLEMIIFYSVCQLCAIDNKFSWLSQGICIFLLCIIFLESLWTVKDTINGREWAWRKFKIDTAKEQMNVIFKDKNSKKTIEDISMFFITNTVYCGYAELIDSDTYVYNADYFTKAGIDSQDFECLYRENENLLSGTIYDIKPYSWKCTEENLYSYIDRLNEFDMVITGIEECDTVIDKVKLLQYTYNPERENEVYCAGEGETAQFIAETDGNTLSWITIPETQVEGKVSRLEIMLDYPDGTTKKICIEADGVMETFEISVGTVKKGTLIRVYSDNEYFIINPRID
jgi:hypothetical protein